MLLAGVGADGVRIDATGWTSWCLRLMCPESFRGRPNARFFLQAWFDKQFWDVMLDSMLDSWGLSW